MSLLMSAFLGFLALTGVMMHAVTCVWCVVCFARPVAMVPVPPSGCADTVTCC
jgi:hypothetical protein